MTQCNIPIDVICVCDSGGEIRPLRFRIEDEGHELTRIDIDEVVNVKKIHYVGVEAHLFLCRATVNGVPWMIELKYTIRSHIWSLVRRVY